MHLCRLYLINQQIYANKSDILTYDLIDTLPLVEQAACGIDGISYEMIMCLLQNNLNVLVKLLPSDERPYQMLSNIDHKANT